MKKRNILHHFLLLLGLLFFATTANGQANVVKGMRAPRLNNSDRNSISAIDATAAKGQVIYNSENDCIEYWNGTRWVSLCTGQAHITFTPALPAMPLPASDGNYGPFTPADEPNCTSQNPAYGFMVMTGGDWLQVDVEDESTGKFRVLLSENATAITRNAIVRVTNNCTQEYKEFLWTQSGSSVGCGTTGAVPAILSENGTPPSICQSDISSGAAYLYLTGRPATGTFIWTLNGQEVGRGTSYIAETGGTYIVYGDKVGCATPAPQSITVNTGNGTSAPAPVQIIAGLNNGYVCSAGGETTIFASGTGNIVWYRNGVRQASKTGNSISAGVGEWFAVVESGSCSSVPSNRVTVSLHPSAGAGGISPIGFTINGTAPSGNTIDLCSDGALLLELTAPHPQAGVSYTWYAGDKENGITLGSGSHANTTVAALGAAPMIQVVGERANSCTQAQYTSYSISAVKNPPARPFVISNTENVICGSATQLTASSAGAASYIWFRDNVELPQTGASLPVDLLGSYVAYGKNAAGCVSLASAAYNVNASSGFASDLKITGNQTPSINTVESYTAAMNNATVGANYTWTVPSPHIIENGQGTPAITVRLGSSTTPFNISVSARNACGMAMPNSAVLALTPANPCNISIVSHTPSNKTLSVPAGTNPGLSVIASSSAAITYRWYRNTTASTVGATMLGASSATLTGETGLTAGTYYFYCVATAACGASPTARSDFFAVTVTANPGTLTPGVGTLVGRTCFDVATNACDGVPASSRPRTNFADRSTQTTTSPAPYSGVQRYVFTALAANVSNVRYEIVHAAGNFMTAQLIDPATPLSGTLQAGALSNGSSVSLDIKYSDNLNSLLAGTGRNDAAKLALYIVYFDGTKDVQIKTVISIQDCACCGAYTAASTFKVFMCHNLGANEALDPFTPGQPGLHGAKYKWGTGIVALDMATDQSTTGTVSGWGSVGGTPPSGGTTTWDMSTRNPCPVGFRVPTRIEYEGLVNNNTWTAKVAPGGNWTTNANNYNAGKMVGTALFLPAAGSRNNSSGALGARGNLGRYWSSTRYNTTYPAYLRFTSTGQAIAGDASAFGFSVRCIEE